MGPSKAQLKPRSLSWTGLVGEVGAFFLVQNSFGVGCLLRLSVNARRSFFRYQIKGCLTDCLGVAISLHHGLGELHGLDVM